MGKLEAVVQARPECVIRQHRIVREFGLADTVLSNATLELCRRGSQNHTYMWLWLLVDSHRTQIVTVVAIVEHKTIAVG